MTAPANIENLCMGSRQAISSHNQPLNAARPGLGYLPDAWAAVWIRFPSGLFRSALGDPGRTRLVGSISPYQQLRPDLETPRLFAGGPDGSQRLLDQFRRGRRCRRNCASQRSTQAADHHHPLRALPTLGLPESGAHFLVGARDPSSIKASCQSKTPLHPAEKKPSACPAGDYAPPAFITAANKETGWNTAAANQATARWLVRLTGMLPARLGFWLGDFRRVRRATLRRSTELFSPTGHPANFSWIQAWDLLGQRIIFKIKKLVGFSLQAYCFDKH